MKEGRLKEIVAELQGASKMHLKQSKEIDEHIDDMESPAKMTSPLKKIGLGGGLLGLASKVVPKTAEIIENPPTFEEVAEAAINVGSLGLRGAAGIASMMLNTNSAYGGTYSDDPRFKMQFQDDLNHDGGPLPEYVPPTDDYELPQLGNGPGTRPVPIANGPLKKLSCWKGYEAKGKKKSPSGKKTKGGKTKMVNNCVKK